MKNNTIRCIAILSLTASLILASCSDKNTIRTEYSDCGLSLNLPEDYASKGLGIVTYGTDVTEYPTMLAYFQYDPAIDKLNEEFAALADEGKEITQELFDSYMEKAMLHYKNLVTITLMPEHEYAEYKKQGFPSGLEQFSEMKAFGKNNGYRYFVKYEETTTDGMEEDEKGLMKECAQIIQNAIKKKKFIKIEVSKPTVAKDNSVSLPEAMPAFSTVDINGTTVDNSFFSHADLTVVNIWGTFCGPCISEMPDLEAWNKTLGSNVQILGIICDVNDANDTDGIEEARQILNGAGVTFTNVLGTGDLKDFLSIVQFVPTTFLVNKAGQIVGDSMVGANVDNYKKSVESYLSGKK